MAAGVFSLIRNGGGEVWVTLKNGSQYNLAHAERIVDVVVDGVPMRRIYNSRGELAGDIHPESLKHLEGAIVPATTGQEIEIVRVASYTGEVFTILKTVVAWRVTASGCIPIPAGEKLRASDWILIPRPDGEFERPDGAIFVSVEEAIDEFRDDWNYKDEEDEEDEGDSASVNEGEQKP